MNVFPASLVLLAAAAVNAPPAARSTPPVRQMAPNAIQAVRLRAGEFRWWPIHAGNEPLQIDCSFEVIEGGGTVHAELVRETELRSFIRHRNYAPLAATENAANGSFRQILRGGDYALIIMNQERAPAAVVSMSIEMNAGAAAVVARTLPASRRIMVILISFAIFFAMAAWSGNRLIRGIRRAAR